jgi:hypothetical protein
MEAEMKMESIEEINKMVAEILEQDFIPPKPRQGLVEMANIDSEATGLNGVLYISTKDECTNKQVHALGRVKLWDNGNIVSVSIKKKKNGLRVVKGNNERMISHLEKFVEKNEDVLWEYWNTPLHLAKPYDLMKKFVKVK